MSSRARRVVPGQAPVHRFDWALGGLGPLEDATLLELPVLAPHGGVHVAGNGHANGHAHLDAGHGLSSGTGHAAGGNGRAAAAAVGATHDPPLTSAEIDARLAELERDAFGKGYAAGERAGVEAGTRRADAMLRRLTETIEEVSRLRASMIQQTERQMVQLALLIARRVVARELSLDVELVAAMAHVALERLGEAGPATIRLNPEDYAALVTLRGQAWAGEQVSIVPEGSLPRGGCVVESAYGRVDAGLDAQIGELARALLGEPLVAPVTIDAANG